MFPILKTEKEIEELKKKGLIENVDFKIGGLFGINPNKEKIYEVIFSGILT